MKRERVYILFSIAVIAMMYLFHIFSISIYPIPWFDETLFASVSKSFLEDGTLFPTAAPFAFQFKDCLTYGPLFFIIQKLSYLIFGFSCFAARIVVLFFGGTMLFMLIKIFKSNKNIPALFLLLLEVGFLFDYTIFDGFHFGRMETMAMTFIFGYTFFILKNENETLNYKRNARALIYSLFAVLAVLTTPRAAILLLPPGLILLYRWYQSKFKKEIFIELLILGLVFITAILSWIFYAFGNIPNMIAYYKIVSETADFSRGFSFSESIYVYQYPVIIASVFLLVISLLVNGKKTLDALNFISVTSVILFYALVTIYRPYGVYTIPYFYILAVNCFYQIIITNPKKGIAVISKLMIYSVLILTIVVSMLKMYYIVLSKDQRRDNAINDFVLLHIPAGSRVIGDEVYYYAVLNAGGQFQYMNWYLSNIEREQYQREIFDYDYLFISDELLAYKPNLISIYKANTKLQLLADFEPILDPITIFLNKKRRGLVSFYNYNGHLYKRIKD